VTTRELHHYARLGALEQARRAVLAFPDILHELNALARNGAAPPARTRAARALVTNHIRAIEPELKAMGVGLQVKDATTTPRRRGRRRRPRISAEGRARIAAAQRKRWAAQRTAGRGAK